MSTTPIEITRAREHDLCVLWSDGHESFYPARYLRLRCRCAGCVEEMTGRPLLDQSAVPQDVHPSALQLVGNYALQPTWSDGHTTGIYTFDHLRSICPCPVCRAHAEA